MREKVFTQDTENCAGAGQASEVAVLSPCPITALTKPKLILVGIYSACS